MCFLNVACSASWACSPTSLWAFCNLLRLPRNTLCSRCGSTSLWAFCNSVCLPCNATCFSAPFVGVLQLDVLALQLDVLATVGVYTTVGAL